jgi:beta-galactosidase GanA
MKKITKKTTLKNVKKTTLKDVLNVISKWQQSNDVTFVGSFVEFDKKDNVINDRLIAYGVKDVIKLELKGLQDELKKEKGKFINW